MAMTTTTTAAAPKSKDADWCNDDFLTFDGNAAATAAAVDDDEEENETIETEEQEEELQDPNLPPWMSSATVPPPSRNNNNNSSNKPMNPLVRLHNEIVDFCSLMEPKPAELQAREELVTRFRALAQTVFGKDAAKVTVFGSQATGLLLPTSDIDIVIEFENDDDDDEKTEKVATTTTQTKKEATDDDNPDNWNVADSIKKVSPLQRLAAAIRDEWFDDLEYLEVIEKTRVPLVKLTTLAGRLSMDICFNQVNGPKAAQLMKTYLHAMPPLRPLTFVMKYFLASRGLNEPYSGGIGSYLLQLMIVSFLQHRERDAYNNNRPSIYNLGCLLVEFLELYGMDMNYITTGISVRHDGFYFPKGARDRKEIYHTPSRPFALAMENPLDPTMDVGKASFRIGVIQRSFDTAFKVLLAHVAEPVLTATSILAAILPSSREMHVRAKTEMGASFRINKNDEGGSNKRQQQQQRKGKSQSKNDDDDDMKSPDHKRQRRR